MLVAACAFLAALAGWYYLFYSRAAESLSSIEDTRRNRMRMRLRRIGGVCMLLLGVCFFALFQAAEVERPGKSFVFLTVAVMALLASLVVLALIDLRLTWKLRRARRSRGGLNA